MSTLITSIVLVGILNTNPVHIQFIDKMSSMEQCQAVIERYIESEQSIPEKERVGNRLQCLTVSYRYSPDGDSPSKPNAIPEKPSVSVPVHEPYPCRHPITKSVVVCKEASYTEQGLHTQ